MHIPRHVWIPSLLLLAGLYGYYRRRDILEALKSPEPGALTVAGWMLAFFILLDMAVIFLSTVYYDSYRVTIQPPSVSLRSVRLLKDKPVVEVVYNVNGTYITGVENCSIGAGKAIYGCSTVTYTNNTVYAGLPSQAIIEALKKSGSVPSVIIHLLVSFRGGNVTGEYSVIIPWRPLDIETLEGGVRVVNPNLLPVNITVQVQYYAIRNGITVFVNKTTPLQVTIPPDTAKTIDIPRKGSFARVVVTYPYKPGSTRIIQEVVRVDFK